MTHEIQCQMISQDSVSKSTMSSNLVPVTEVELNYNESSDVDYGDENDNEFDQLSEPVPVLLPEEPSILRIESVETQQSQNMTKYKLKSTSATEPATVSVQEPSNHERLATLNQNGNQTAKMNMINHYVDEVEEDDYNEDDDFDDDDGDDDNDEDYLSHRNQTTTALKQLSVSPLSKEEKNTDDKTSLSFKCQFCPTPPFENKKQWYNHIYRFHKGQSQKRYFCTPCDTSYSTSEGLMHHQKQFHVSVNGSGNPSEDQYEEKLTMTSGTNNVGGHVSAKIEGQRQVQIQGPSPSPGRDRPKRVPPGNFHKLNDYVTDKVSKVSKKVAKVKVKSGHLKTVGKYKHKHKRSRNLRCQYCGKMYIRSYMLNMHVRSHEGDRPYSCQYCSVGFVSSGRLSKHMKKSKRCQDAAAENSLSSSAAKVPGISINGKGPEGPSLFKSQQKNNLISTVTASTSTSGIIERRSYPPAKSHIQAQIPIPLLSGSGSGSGSPPSKLSVVSNQLPSESPARLPPKLIPEVEIEERIVDGKTFYICNYCGQQYVYKFHAQNHVRSHTGHDILQCPKCTANFTVHRTLAMHMRSCKGIDEIKKSVEMSSIARKRKSFKRKKAFARGKSSKFAKARAQRQSLKEKHQENGVADEDDDQIEEAEVNLNENTDMDLNNSVNQNSNQNRVPKSPKMKFVCQICGIQYMYQGWLDRHMQSCRPGPVPMSMPIPMDQLRKSVDNNPNHNVEEEHEDDVEDPIVEASSPNNSIADPLLDQESEADSDDSESEIIIMVSSDDESEMIGIEARTDSSNRRDPTCYIYAHHRTFSFWDSVLNKPFKRQMVAPVDAFKHAPLADVWEEIAKVGLCLEIKNPLFKEGTTVDKVWMGKIQDIRGYMILIDFETFGTRRNADEHKMWISLLSKDVLPLFSCDKEHLVLDSEPFVRAKILSEIDNTLYQNFYQNPTVDVERHFVKFLEEVDNIWKLNENCEALDVRSPHQNRLAYIKEIKGNLILVNYYFSANYYNEESTDGYDKGFWCHFQSEYIHKLGWSRKVGIDLNGGDFDFKYMTDPSVSLSIRQIPENTAVDIQEGMVLEVRHPTLTNKIVGAVILRVLNHGYFIIETRERQLPHKLTRTRFVFHLTSPFVFQMGFGKEHGIQADFDIDQNEFTVNSYLRLDRLPPRPMHKFSVGHRLEAPMPGQPELIHPATVKTIAGHLLLLHFDGKNKALDENYQWVDSDSIEIYPIGYAESFGFELQGNVRFFNPQPLVLQSRHALPLEYPLNEYFE